MSVVVQPRYLDYSDIKRALKETENGIISLNTKIDKIYYQERRTAII